MNGSVFTGSVIRTITVPAFKDSSTGIQKSEIVHTEPPFVALNVDAAKAFILAAAITKAKVDVGDPTAPVEVRITNY